MPNLAIVVSEFNAEVTALMLERARARAGALGLTVVQEVRVPGVFDTPLALQRLLRRGDVDGVVVLGAVIQGETGHDAVIMHAAARKITDLAVAHDKPVGLGISGPGQTPQQARDRADRADQAVEAVASLLKGLEGL